MPAKLTQFSVGGPLTGDEPFGSAQGGTNVQISANQILTFVMLTVQPLIDGLQSQINAISAGFGLLPSSEIATANYTIQSTDVYNAYELTYVGAVTITIPLNSSEPCPVGSRVRFTDIFGSASFALEDPSIEITSLDNAMISRGANAIFEAHKIGTDQWALLGDLQ